MINVIAKVTLAGICLSAWLGLQWFALRTVEPSDTRYLIITADDAGLCPAVNEATIQALDFGLVSSASMMVVCPAFDEFAQYAVAHPEHDYGVHLVLTAENPEIPFKPILGNAVPSLVRFDGTFWRKPEEVAVNARIDEVALELEAQVRRALDRGIRVSHLDHHMWVLLQRPDLLKVYVQLALEFQIPLRIHREFVAEECGAALQSAGDYDRIIQPLINRATPLIDFIEANNYLVTPTEKQQYFTAALKALPIGVSEFVIHCSVNRPGLQLPGNADGREADFRVFTSTDVRSQVHQLGIQIINWKELSQLKRKGKI